MVIYILNNVVFMQIGLQAFMPVQEKVSSVFFIRIFHVYPCIWSNFYEFYSILKNNLEQKLHQKLNCYGRTTDGSNMGQIL